MNIYIFAVHDEIDEKVEALTASLTVWAEPKTTISWVARTPETEDKPKTKLEFELGYEIAVSKTQKLKEPLNFLYQVAKEQECEFVVGLVEDDKYQDVCYFGFEEGRPDMFEIAHYLGLEK